MKKVPLPLHGGESLEIHGGLSERRIVPIVERNDSFADDALVAQMIT